MKDENSDKWELFDLEKDRTEKFNLASKHTDILKKMINKWDEWAKGNYVYPKGDRL